jgi:hypothetical protein
VAGAAVNGAWPKTRVFGSSSALSSDLHWFFEDEDENEDDDDWNPAVSGQALNGPGTD